MILRVLASQLALLGCVAALPARETPSAERGKVALQTRAFTSGAWRLSALDEVWKYWDTAPKEKPDDYPRAVREYYGLHPAPFDNGRYPMGLREGPGLIGKGLATDCLLCHGGSIFGKSYVGLGNHTLDVHALFQDMGKASGGPGKLPFTFSNVRGTSEAAAFAVFLLGYRDRDLNIRLKPGELDLRDDLCEDVPAWWLLHKKRTMYFTGTTPARSVRSIMQFMLASTFGPAVFDKEEATFRDVQAYILSLRAPKYPFPIDTMLAARGEGVFRKNCTTCHGTYGADWTYPNKVVPLDFIGTDPNRFHGISAKWGHFYNESWFAREESGWFDDGGKVTEPNGYQAPPLDGVWATAPYLHNGSVPTLHDLLDSKSRPALFTRSYRTDEASYDREKVGWKVEVVEQPPGPDVPAVERRKVYDTRQPGRRNTGHTFGDDLTADERRAVIEYLKTL